MEDKSRNSFSRSSGNNESLLSDSSLSIVCWSTFRPLQLVDARII